MSYLGLARYEKAAQQDDPNRNMSYFDAVEPGRLRRIVSSIRTMAEEYLRPAFYGDIYEKIEDEMQKDPKERQTMLFDIKQPD